MNIKKNIILFIYILVSIAFTAYQIQFNLAEEEIGFHIDASWGFFTLLCSTLWCYYDSLRTRFQPVFDFGDFLWLFWPVLIPIYLYKTRGGDGLLILFGLIALNHAPYSIGDYFHAHVL